MLDSTLSVCSRCCFNLEQTPVRDILMTIQNTDIHIVTSTIKAMKDAVSSRVAVLAAILVHIPTPCLSVIIKPDCAAGTSISDKAQLTATIFKDTEKLISQFPGKLTIFSYRL